MIVNTMHHVAIIVSDLDKTKDFYVNKLGFQLFREVCRPEVPDQLWMLRRGEVVLELFIRPNAPQRVTQPEALGLRHLAFHVDSVPEAIEWLNSRGIETGPILMDTNNNINKPVVFFWDPDGTPLELHE